MRSLFIGVSLLALMAPAAYAQQAPKPATHQEMPAASTAQRPAMTQPSATTQANMAKYLVFFDWDKATLTPEARRVVATAADEYKKTGAAKIVATGYTDLSGTKEYNLKLSERRADAVKAELVRLGVPANVITTIGMGEADPLVPTKDGVREAQNRRVEIQIPVPPKAVEAPKPVPAAAPPPPPPPPPPPKWAASIGPWYGYNLKQLDKKNNGGGTPKDSLFGPQVSLEYAVTPNLPVRVDLGAFNTLGTAHNDGWGGRGTGGIDYQGNLGALHPFIGAYGGYDFGHGVQDGAIVGPELGLKYDFSRNVFGYAKAAYDFQLRNEWKEGIPNGSIGAGIRW